MVIQDDQPSTFQRCSFREIGTLSKCIVWYLKLTEKNKANKLIIVYHEDDKNGATYATVLYEKGFDNIYLLTGGIEEFYQKKPSFVTGSDLPPLKSELGTGP